MSARRITVARSDTPWAERHRVLDEASRRCAREPAEFDPAAWEPSLVARARALWAARMASEHRSSAVFASMLPQLLEAGAALDHKSAVAAMAMDELRHTETCAAVLVAYGGDGACEAEPLGAVMPAHPGCSPEERALRNVIFGCCLSETVNAARFAALLDVTREPVAREATRQLLADEVWHGRFGWHYLSAWGPWLAERPEVRATLSRYLARAFAHYERDHAGRPGPPPTADAIALGIPAPELLRAAFYDTVEQAVVPGLDRFGLDASRAWRERSLDPP